MKIDNKFNIKQEVYIGEEKGYVNAIHIMDNGSLEYQIWTPNGNNYGTFSDWQIGSGKTSKIGFKDD